VSAYSRLQRDEEIPEPAELVRWAHWARLDARLAEILTKFLRRNFRRIHPTGLWEENRFSPRPQALAVLASFALVGIPRRGEEFRALDGWVRAVTWRTPKASPQMFFVRDGNPKPERDALEIEESLALYRKWGFFGRENLAGSKAVTTHTMLAPEERKKILAKLMRARKRFTVSDYRAACEFRVHSRTAERDLSACPRLRKSGGTRGTMYIVK
jgi:hypothetical protein